ncbi:LysR substrate-binding domain-containing protein [Dactylosporangium sp. AC04546]|uniref:LysR substrate-binding domain-containing protein n=1 Tax=Dactylosporangium sp. AC04546 TaxID=2862460 RepID=UPI001EDCBF27|nr:LysR substrate-binding domain-containing protein [Dactylosporangium sp. AC04546]WVK81385.1 LysR substrate-binding domain-containing protein [Dactylosporangium sp. AC04546]
MEKFRLVVVPGVVVDRWARTWAERRPQTRLELVPAEAADAPGYLPDRAEAGLIRPPLDRDVVHAIPLYSEQTVVVVPREHLLAAADELTLAEVTALEEPLLRPADEVLALGGDPGAPTDRPATTALAMELVAAEAGLLLVPMSLARLHHRRDLTYRPVTDAPTSSVVLAWPRDAHTDLVEEMIGIVRGRTANSTRGRDAQPPKRSRRR